MFKNFYVYMFQVQFLKEYGQNQNDKNHGFVFMQNIELQNGKQL